MTSQPQPSGTAAPGPAPRRTVGDYTLLSKIGEGGMGVVHLARKEGGVRVALKVLRPHIVGDDEARARLAREVGSLSRIRSRWVAEIVDADPWAPVPYVATRYVPGLSLHDHAVEEGPITGADLTWFAACLAEGVASVHAVGVLHRDVKPSNVLMEGRTPILIDFGLARVADDPKLTHTGWLLGTPGYLAPEILHGEDATAASDVHSWAATVAFAATGHPPFGRGPSMAIMDRVRRGEHDLSGVPVPLRDALASALDPDPLRRPSLEVLLGWLRPQVAAGAPAPEPPAPVEDPFTIPLALAAHSAAEGVTDRIDPAPPAPPTRPLTVVETQVEPVPVPAPAPMPAPVLAPTPVEPDARSRMEQEWDEQWGEPAPEAAPARPSFGERARRGSLLVTGALAVGAGVAAGPWLATALLMVAVWLLRSGSLAASAAGDRRRLRGTRWYDGPRLLLGAPWDLLRSIPGTLLLQVWALGLAVAAALVCYAVAAGLVVTLAVSGVVLAVALWSGPGGSRVRSPLGRVVRPLCRTAQGWLVAMIVVVAVGGGCAWLVTSTGTDWTPGTDRPFADVELPSYLRH